MVGLLNLEAEEFRRGVRPMNEMVKEPLKEPLKYTIKISSGSNPPGLAPYSMTPSIYDGVTTRTFETKEKLEQVLMQFEDAKQAGIDLVFRHIAENGYTIFETKLSEETAKSLGWN
jgi:hypothetical protein